MGGPHDRGPGADGALVARLGRLSRRAVDATGVDGAGITVMGGFHSGLLGHRDQVWSTGALTSRLEDLQLTAGEGPCLEAFRHGAPVLVGDLAAAVDRWPGFAPEALAAGAAAVFSFPLQVGTVRLGTLDLHRDVAGPLSREQRAVLRGVAELVTEVLLELAAASEAGPVDPGAAGAPGEESAWLPGAHAEVHQASGMVAARAEIGVAAALLRIRAFAFARTEPIDEVAHRIIERALVLDESPRGPATADGGAGRSPPAGRPSDQPPAGPPAAPPAPDGAAAPDPEKGS